MAQARRAGLRLRGIIGDGPVYMYHSPYLRAVQTAVEVLRGLDPAQVKTVQEEPRIAQQQFGNLPDTATLRQCNDERLRYGRFFYRFPNGEAGLDVYSRISGFIGSLRRGQARLGPGSAVVVVTHGVAIRLFLTHCLGWTVEEFEASRSLELCDMAVLELVTAGGTCTCRLTDMTLDILGAAGGAPPPLFPPSSPSSSPAAAVAAESALGRDVHRRAFVDAFLSY